MQKTILFLINGFGIATKNSYPVYKPELMPTMDGLSKKDIFASLQCRDFHYKNGYRTFNVGAGGSSTYSMILKRMEQDNFVTDPNILEIGNQVIARQGHLHIFVVLEDEKVIEPLRQFIKAMRTKGNFKIVVDILLGDKAISEYKMLGEIINKIKYNYGDIDNIQAGVIAGKNYLADPNQARSFIRMLFTERGESWNEVERKFQLLSGHEIIPANANPFLTSTGCQFYPNDLIFFFNFSKVSCQPFLDALQETMVELKQPVLPLISLFPLANDTKVPFLFQEEANAVSLSHSLVEIAANGLIITTPERGTYINYACNGFQEKPSPQLRVGTLSEADLYQADKLVSIIASQSFDLLVLDYAIEDCDSIEAFQSRFQQIDQIMQKVLEYCQKQQIVFVLSSLYGTKKEVLYHNAKSLVDFSAGLPFIVSATAYPKKDYRVDLGTAFELRSTICKLVNPDLKENSLLKKKGGLFSMFGGKKKK